MKLRSGIRSMFVVLLMAMMFTAVAPVVFPNANVAMAAKKSKKSSKKSAKVNLKINKTMASVKVGKSVALKVTGNAKKTVKWSTSNGKVASLSSKSGTKIKVKGLKDGVAAITAKVGSSKVTCCVYVGKGSYADASAKTKKALGNPIKLLASYVAKHPITVDLGNQNSGYNPYNTNSYTSVFSLKVEGNNLVVGRTDTEKYDYKRKDGSYSSSETDVYTSTMSIPIDGSPTAVINYDYSSSYTGTGETPSSSRTTYSFSFNINTVTPGTEVEYTSTRTRSDGTTYQNSPTKRAFYTTANYSHLVDVLHCFLVDNNTGFKAKDIGFNAYTPSHKNIGLLTNADMAAFAAQMESMRNYNQAHYTPDDEE